MQSEKCLSVANLRAPPMGPDADPLSRHTMLFRNLAVPLVHASPLIVLQIIENWAGPALLWYAQRLRKPAPTPLPVQLVRAGSMSALSSTPPPSGGEKSREGTPESDDGKSVTSHSTASSVSVRKRRKRPHLTFRAVGKTSLSIVRVGAPWSCRR